MQNRLYSLYETARKKQFPSTITFAGTLPSSDNLDSNSETELTVLIQGTFLSSFV